MLQDFERFLSDESGAEVVEYIMITLGVLVFTVAIVGVFGGKLKEMWVKINGFLDTIMGWNAGG
ncbi:MAG: Flp family type IVb pilin [Chloroflexi bacterium]|nr:Flp family type IVb pilin [Chloroflexota bacterium]